MCKYYIKALTLLLLLLPTFAHAEVFKIVFTTEPQVVKPGEISTVLTIQSQDSSSNSSPTTETLDLEFTSTSATGEYLGATGNPVTKTMNRNTANRSFYYRDSATGTFTLTVKATGRDRGKILEASQSITVSSTVAPPAEEEDDEEDPPKDSEKKSSSTSSASSHYSSTPATTYISGTSLKVGAGRVRISTVGTPIEFTAETNIERSSTVRYEWNFGDGMTDRGERVVHAYSYPGEYIVILNVSAGSDDAVSRTTVRVSEAELGITYAGSDRIEVANNSNQEVNLYGRALGADDKVFVFPQDTIIASGQKISFSSALTGLAPQDDFYTSLFVVGETPNISELKEKLKSQVENNRKIALIHEEIVSLQSALAQLEPPQREVRTVAQEAKVEVNEEEETEVAVSESNISLSATAILATTSETQTSENWWSTFKKFFLWKR